MGRKLHTEKWRLSGSGSIVRDIIGLTNILLMMVFCIHMDRKVISQAYLDSSGRQ